MTDKKQSQTLTPDQVEKQSTMAVLTAGQLKTVAGGAPRSGRGGSSGGGGGARNPRGGRSGRGGSSR